MSADMHETCDETMTFDLPGPPRVHGCARPAGHSGWHRDRRSGASWIERMPGAGCYDDAALVAAYERGVAAGRRQAADAIRVALAEDLADSDVSSGEAIWEQCGYRDGLRTAAGIAEESTR